MTYAYIYIYIELFFTYMCGCKYIQYIYYMMSWNMRRQTCTTYGLLECEQRDDILQAAQWDSSRPVLDILVVCEDIPLVSYSPSCLLHHLLTCLLLVGRLLKLIRRLIHQISSRSHQASHSDNHPPPPNLSGFRNLLLLHHLHAVSKHLQFNRWWNIFIGI